MAIDWQYQICNIREERRMTRLIDADALKEHFKRYTINSGIQVSLDRYALKVIEEEPTVDAVPVIRCQDCKHCETMTIFGKTTLYTCTRKNPAVDVLPSDYCSRGRRKDES